MKNIKKVYGPYKRKDNRQHVLIIYKSGKRRTVSYPKFLLEQEEKKILPRGIDVHHVDEDVENNDTSNLEVITHAEHSRKHHPGYVATEAICFWCNKKFRLTGKQISARKRNARRGRKGPFCSRNCSGRYGKRIQITAGVA